MKKALTFILALAAVFSLAACTSSKPQAPTSSKDIVSDKPVVLKFAAHFSNTISLGEYVSQAKTILEEVSGGKMTLDMYFNESLVKQPDAFLAVGQGICDISYISTQQLSDVAMANMYKTLYPAGALDIDSMTSIYRRTLTETPIQENLEQYNMHCLTIRALGGKQLITSKKLITSPADLKGLNIAANGNDSFFYDACGAGAVALSNADYFSAFSNGMVDGESNHYVSLTTYGLHEVGKYVTEFNGGLEASIESYMINLDTWNSLTEEQQGWLVETFTQVSDLAGAYDKTQIEKSRQTCIDQGLQVYTLSEEEMAEFAPHMEKVNSDWIVKATKEGWDAQGAYDFIVNAVAEAS